ncbi:hypothetical protein OS493_023797 [Desmophyllum pertusum]|uniref:Adenylate cyclase type 9 n=1 Tax=Desmophyllum pertusum TaxID=174260 RepID=A0A9W9YM59_9CNID|nr:hypothetical protein OS493_023797 [Desmophyllum pertusum]
MAGEERSGYSISTDPESMSVELKPSFAAIKKERSYSQVDTRQKKGCIPLFFERASSQWWMPRFDSEILEEEFQRFTAHNQRRVVHALMFVCLVCITWGIFFAVSRRDEGITILIGDGVFLALVIALILFTKFSKLYKKCVSCVSLLASVLLITMELSLFGFPKALMNPARFCMCTCVIVLIYTMIHSLHLYICILMTVAFSVAHEVLSDVVTTEKGSDNRLVEIICRLVLHMCIHLFGIQIFFMAQTRERSTFWKVGQCVVARRDLEIEKQVKEQMIRSVMPDLVAKELLHLDEETEEDPKDSSNGKKKRRNKGQMVFRPFQMHRMENVSILFADIVGFTKMSGNKSAEQLVRLLNDLFGRFDRLTEINNCEKISTLGDCYYCVAGCPEATAHHAFNCVEMGLDMLEQIKEFDEDTKNEVDMRVGVHTGTVLCGVVGTLRFKFDVWSNDVNLANRMETAGLPGRVHITEATRKFLAGHYIVEDGNAGSRHQGLEGIKTYFIVGRKNGMKKPMNLLHPTGRGKKSTNLNSINVTMNASHHHHNHHHSSPQGKKKHVKISEQVTSSDAMFNSDSNISSQGESSSDNGPKVLKGNLKVKHDVIEMEYYSCSGTSIKSDDEEEDSNGRVPEDRRSSQVLGISLNEALMRDTLRTNNDTQLVSLMSQERALAGDEYLHGSMNPCTLQFQDKYIERRYQNEGQDCTLLNPSVTTFASPRVNFFIDVLLSNIIYLVIMILGFPLYQPVPLAVIILSPFSLLIEITLFFLTVARAFPRMYSACMNSVVGYISGWFISHLIGALLMCLPMGTLFANFMNCGELRNPRSRDFYSLIFALALLHFCNFTQLSSWMKTGLAAVFSITYIVLLNYDNFCAFQPIIEGTGIDQAKALSENDRLGPEIMVCIGLLLVFVCLLNRQLEMTVRRNFSGDEEAAKDKRKAQTHKEQAAWLLESIFPKHVADALKLSSHYSRNYENVGVIFASIVNFSDFYEENFEGGKECIRVLNELVGDFDDLLSDKTQFSQVEKIKTVNGSTFMAGAGLYPEGCMKKDAHPYDHLKQLVKFALGMFKVVDRFNEHMLGFEFQLRLGFNAGPVTAGVIGSTKLLYDIWGDTVNIASRMDSTGLTGRIQVSEASKKLLDEFFTFERRGAIAVKGKGDITTYLLTGKRTVCNIL